jgi:hypothetical protein
LGCLMPLRAVYLDRRVSLVQTRLGDTALGDRVEFGPPHQRETFTSDTDTDTDIDVTSSKPSVFGRFKFANT